MEAEEQGAPRAEGDEYSIHNPNPYPCVGLQHAGVYKPLLQNKGLELVTRLSPSGPQEPQAVRPQKRIYGEVGCLPRHVVAERCQETVANGEADKERSSHEQRPIHRVGVAAISLGKACYRSHVQGFPVNSGLRINGRGHFLLRIADHSNAGQSAPARDRRCGRSRRWRFMVWSATFGWLPGLMHLCRYGRLQRGDLQTHRACLASLSRAGPVSECRQLRPESYPTCSGLKAGAALGDPPRQLQLAALALYPHMIGLMADHTSVDKLATRLYRTKSVTRRIH
mmetsp:Transcript_7714/g.21947  ORF Transcript_7714/g.21947 Transcript_7714/m.21947 type:complete len:282 (-) Transcript_7714:168-1013(-)